MDEKIDFLKSNVGAKKWPSDCAERAGEIRDEKSFDLKYFGVLVIGMPFRLYWPEKEIQSSQTLTPTQATTLPYDPTN
jgi:hypothetical protein